MFIKKLKGVSVTAATKGPAHHFFGFHDLTAWNHADTKLLGLEVDEMNHPPMPGQLVRPGFVDCSSGKWISVAETEAFNYPQGAREQWIGASENIIFNAKVGSQWGAMIYDTDSGKHVKTLSSTAHVIDADKGLIFGINYARLNRLGVYGYAGIADWTANEKSPANDGIWVNSMTSDNPELLVSIKEVAELDMPEFTRNFSHYITHLVMNPDNSRIAFLHRYRTGEGEITRLMTIGTDGSNLRCLGSGALSHYDWSDNDKLIIWGRMSSMAENIRSGFIYSIIPKHLLRFMKKQLVPIIRKRNLGNVHSGSMLVFTDADNKEPETILKGIVSENGHQMFNPQNRDWMICDNYPDENGIRTLFLCKVSLNERFDIGEFKRLFQDPDKSRLDDAFIHLDKDTFSKDAMDNLPFFRSGLHCDLHPRWNYKGTKVSFDSIHEGTRQIYTVDLEEAIKNEGT